MKLSPYLINAVSVEANLNVTIRIFLSKEDHAVVEREFYIMGAPFII